MHKHLRATGITAALLLAAIAPGAAAQQLTPCSAYSLIVDGSVDAAGENNGTGPIFPGQTVTITLTAGTATSATWNIVGNATGVPVLAGPGGLGSTLTYTEPVDGTLGVGYFITAINGTALITASCTQGVLLQAASIPTLDTRMLWLLAGLLGIFAAWRLRPSLAQRG